MPRLASVAALIVLLLTSALALAPERAAADLTMTPQRVVFDSDQRSATVHVINTSDARKAYDITWSQQRMRPDGALMATESLAGAASSFLVLSPRRLSLEPGGSQTIRLSARRPAALPPGEYRSHLQLTPLPDAGDGGGPSDRGLSARLKVRLSFSMPVIVRHGGGTTEVALKAQKLDLDSGALLVRLDRTGPFSTFGDLYAFWRPNAASELTPIGRLESVAVYPELAAREAAVPLYADARAKLSGGEVFVYYVDPANNRVVLAEAGARL